MDVETKTCYVGLGSNLGDRAGNLLLAVRGLMEAGLQVDRLSAIYETEPVGVVEHDRYLNMVAEITISNISPSQMIARMIRLEYLLGRRHKFLNSPRTVDLDLLLYGDQIIDTKVLQIPHKRLHERRFVLVPLCELAPHVVHPGENKTIFELLESLDDESKVLRWYPNGEMSEQLGKETVKSIQTS